MGQQGKRFLCGWGIAFVARLNTLCPLAWGLPLLNFQFQGGGCVPAHPPSPDGRELYWALALPGCKMGFPSEHWYSPHDLILLSVSRFTVITPWGVSPRRTEPCSLSLSLSCLSSQRLSGSSTALVSVTANGKGRKHDLLPDKVPHRPVGAS